MTVTAVLKGALTACALKEACVLPAGTVTELGSDIVTRLPVYPSDTATPTVGAAASVTTHELDPGTVMLDGAQVSPERVLLGCVIVMADPVVLIGVAAPLGSLADIALTTKDVVELLDNVTAAVAITPSGMTLSLKLQTTQTYCPAFGLLQVSCFAAVDTDTPAEMLIEEVSGLE